MNIKEKRPGQDANWSISVVHRNGKDNPYIILSSQGQSILLELNEVLNLAVDLAAGYRRAIFTRGGEKK